MSTNRPNPQQHNNQPNRQPQERLTPREENRVAAAIAISQEQEKVAAAKEMATAVPKTFKEILSDLFVAVLFEEITPHQAQLAMHVWYKDLSLDMQEAFKLSRNQNDIDLGRLKGIAEMLAQEIPYLYIS